MTKPATAVLLAGKIAAIALTVLRCDHRPADLAGGNGKDRTTVTRWVRKPWACSLPVQSHAPATSVRTPTPVYTRPVTRNFTMHSA